MAELKRRKVGSYPADVVVEVMTGTRRRRIVRGRKTALDAARSMRVARMEWSNDSDAN